MRRVWLPVVTVTLLSALVAGCGKSHPAEVAAQPTWAEPTLSASATEAASPSPSPSPSAKPSATRKPTPKPTKTSTKIVTPGGDIPTTKASPSPVSDGVPTRGAGTFAIAGGSTDVVGTGTTLVKYQVEVEQGINWGTITPWTPSSFASTVDAIIAAERGWTDSGAHPVTDADEQMTDASWAFRRVSDGTYSVRVRLATPDTVDKLCGSAGVQTQGVYSCRYGKNILINLRRWLKGTTGFTNLPVYRTMVINHEMGHYLGFNHMLCPGAGQVAPVMQTQTIALNGCLPNSHPFTAEGQFVIGPWAPS
ncbi:DUF3152 domain-containing protein [Hamadaea sp. NPDC050747]|uniref:DUF3152 domain-containing protein n=1 Tax=Hamadaea sp. NPDC050747 TaxID=3155789 RepID=UPI0033C714AF